MTTKRVGARVGAALLLVVIGCGDDIVEPGRVLVPGGRIAGLVRTGGIPVEAVAQATRVTVDPDDHAVFLANLATDATFQMDVPAGRYIVGLSLRDVSVTYEYRAAGLGAGAPDTLVVDEVRSPVFVSFDLAGLRVHLDVSSELDGADGTVRLHRRGAAPTVYPSVYILCGRAPIANGALDVVIPGVLPGAYKVQVVLTPRAGRFPTGGEFLWMPGVRDSAHAPWFDVATDETIDVTGRADQQPARIRGQITGAWMELGVFTPPATALFSLDSTVVHSLQGVDPDGKFEMRLAIPGAVRVLVDHMGIQQWIGGRDFADAEVFQLDPGRVVTGVDLVQSALVLDVETSASAVGSLWVRLYDPETRSLVAAWSEQNVTNFRLAMPNLVPGMYLMHMESWSPGRVAWAPQWFDRTNTVAQAAPITIDHAGEVVHVAVVLEIGGTIAGMVRDVEGGMGDYFVYITRADDPARWGYDFARNDRPEFGFEGLPNGDWKVGVWRRYPDPSFPDAPPIGTVWFPSTTDWEAAQAIPIRDFNDVTGIDIAMPESRR